MNRVFIISLLFSFIGITGCSHQPKNITTTSNKNIVDSNRKVILQTIHDIVPAQEALISCDPNYFNKINNEDYKFLKQERVFDFLWENFLKNSVDDKLRTKSLEIL